jgi:uncharacterized peroxidase-related enzyme
LLEKEGMAEAERDALVSALERDHRTARLAPRARALLDYAVKLTLTPAGIAAGDIARLRAVGLDDRGIHDLCAIVGYYAFVNRIADGLGVELEPRWGVRESDSAEGEA